MLLEEGVQIDPRQLANLLVQHRISHVLRLPSLYTLLLDEAQHQQLGFLQAVIVAGESCARELVDRHHRMLAGTALFNEYGPTEGTVWSSVYHCESLGQSGLVPIGRPIANTQIYILDSHLQPESCASAALA